MLSASCACNSVTVQVKAQPEYVNNCNCSLCKSTGALWGYFESSQVGVVGKTKSYRRADKETPSVEIHFCPECGATTHWVMTEAAQDKFPDMDRMGVNMRLYKDEDLYGVEVRYPDGENWNTVDPYTYRKPHFIVGPNDPV